MAPGNNQTTTFFERRCINLDIGIRCTLLCPGCSRQNDLENIRPVPGHDMTIAEYRKIIGYFSEVIMCGQQSDPVFNPSLLDFIKMSKTANTKLGIHTAASHKAMRWYEEAFDNFGDGYWTFGIDGLPQESHKYRINQNGVKLFEIAKLCASKNIITNWQYIIFKYNEDHINQARNMAEENNINFIAIKSSRFGKVHDQIKYKPTNPEYFLERS